MIGETRFNRKFPLVERHCFNVDCLRLVENYPENTGKLNGSFHLLSVMKGRIKLQSAACGTLEAQFGDSVLVPANCGNYQIQPLDGSATVLKSYLK